VSDLRTSSRLLCCRHLSFTAVALEAGHDIGVGIEDVMELPDAMPVRDNVDRIAEMVRVQRMETGSGARVMQRDRVTVSVSERRSVPRQGAGRARQSQR
jgi:uncharacterized protein (DUF849 family)